MKLFLYNDDFDMNGDFAVLHGFRLAMDKCHRRPELLEAASPSSVYGRVVDVDEFDLEKFDTYYCLGLEVYHRIEVEVVLGGGETIVAFTYKFNVEEPVK